MVKQIVRQAAIKPSSIDNPNPTIINMQQALIVDTETTTDFEQKLKIAGFSLINVENEKSYAIGLFYDKNNLKQIEIDRMKEYTKKNNLLLLERETFILKWFYPLLLKGVPYVNHNLKFDIGAMATSWDCVDKDTIRMGLCNCTEIKGINKEGIYCRKHPPILIRHLPSGKYLFSFDTDNEIGCIIDTMQLGKSLMGASCPGSLIDMGNAYKCKIVKVISDEHGLEIQEDYLDYTMNDVRATAELYCKQVELYKKYDIPIPISRIISEASVGKGIYHKIGFKPIQKQHNIPTWYESIAAKTYIGGRSEVMHRCKPVEILYLDFMSEYPFSVAFLGLQEIQQAKTLKAIHCTKRIQKLLNTFKLEDLQKKDYGKQLRVFVKIIPNMDILPLRAKLENDNDNIVRNTYVVGQKENWYTLLDVIGSVIRTNKVPEILDAIELIPYGKQYVQPINFFNEEEYYIDANNEDFAARLIDVRSSVKKNRNKFEKDSEDYTNLEVLQVALKLIANSTTYGMYCETREVEGIDVLGKFACYAIGSLIPACGRFLLSVTEALGMKKGLRYVMCDTDSMSFAIPYDLFNLSKEEKAKKRKQFKETVKEIQDFFKPLSPFKSSNDILELEEVNGEDTINNPLYFIGISTKRYVCYHKITDEKGNITYHIKKATVNGVGYIQLDRDKEVIFPEDIPNPFTNKKYKPTKYLSSWQYLLWYRAIQQFEEYERKNANDRPITIPVETWSNQIVRHQVGVNTPRFLKQYEYIGVRPFSFFTMLPCNGIYPGFYSHSFGTSSEIKEKQLYVIGTGKKVENIKLKKLYEHFNGYFNYVEKKVLDGSKIGWLEKRIVAIDEIEAQTKKGKKATIQPSLFDMMEGV